MLQVLLYKKLPEMHVKHIVELLQVAHGEEQFKH